MLWTWVSTVRSESTSSSTIRRLVRPWETSAAISCSRRLSGAGRRGRLPGLLLGSLGRARQGRWRYRLQREVDGVLERHRPSFGACLLERGLANRFTKELEVTLISLDLREDGDAGLFAQRGSRPEESCRLPQMVALRRDAGRR